MEYKHIEVEVKEGIGSITLNRPPVNVLNIEMMNEINDVLKSWLEDKDLKVVLFKAKGKCFSAGVDVGEHMGDMAPKMIEVFHGMFRLLNRFEIPTVASIYGSCLGGGCELAIFCDMVIAAESTKLGQPEIQVGVLPPIAAQVMPRIIGRKAAMELILSGRVISAQEAFRMGLVNKVVKDEDLESETEKFVEQFKRLSPIILKKNKKAIVLGLMENFEESLQIIEEIYLDELMKTEDAEEGLKSFLEKRKPVWKNK